MKGESRVRLKILEALESLGASVHVYHATPYGETGHPDLYGTYRGRAFWFEVKPPGWTPRSTAERLRHARQIAWLERELEKGGVCAVVRTPDFASSILLKSVDKGLDNEMDKVYIEPVIN